MVFHPTLINKHAGDLFFIYSNYLPQVLLLSLTLVYHFPCRLGGMLTDLEALPPTLTRNRLLCVSSLKFGTTHLDLSFRSAHPNPGSQWGWSLEPKVQKIMLWVHYCTEKKKKRMNECVEACPADYIIPWLSVKTNEKKLTEWQSAKFAL